MTATRMPTQTNRHCDSRILASANDPLPQRPRLTLQRQHQLLLYPLSAANQLFRRRDILLLLLLQMADDDAPPLPTRTVPAPVLTGVVTQRAAAVLKSSDVLRHQLIVAPTACDMVVAMAHLLFFNRLMYQPPFTTSPNETIPHMLTNSPDLPLPYAIRRKCPSCRGTRYPYPPTATATASASSSSSSVPAPLERCGYCVTAARLCSLLRFAGYHFVDDADTDAKCDKVFAQWLRLDEPPTRVDITIAVRQLVRPVYSAAEPHEPHDNDDTRPPLKPCPPILQLQSDTATERLVARVPERVLREQLPPAESLIGVDPDLADPATERARQLASAELRHTYLAVVAPSLMRTEDQYRQREAFKSGSRLARTSSCPHPTTAGRKRKRADKTTPAARPRPLPLPPPPTTPPSARSLSTATALSLPRWQLATP